jgi:hypothetical protein
VNNYIDPFKYARPVRRARKARAGAPLVTGHSGCMARGPNVAPARRLRGEKGARDKSAGPGHEDPAVHRRSTTGLLPATRRATLAHFKRLGTVLLVRLRKIRP